MDKKDILKMLQELNEKQAETICIETKKANQGRPEKYYDTISSFANTMGGVILFGVEEKKRKNNGSYIRVGDRDDNMTEYEIYKCISYRENVRDDLKPVLKATLKDFDEKIVSKFIANAKADKPKFAEFSDEEILLQYGALTEIGDKIFPTVAGIMVFGIYPQKFFPQWFVAAIVVPGFKIADLGDEGQRFDDNKKIEGNNTIELLETRKAMEVRNETIVKLLETLGEIIENRHTGIFTMQKKMKEANLPEPVFTNEREDFVVTFYNGEYPELYPEKMRNEQNDKSTKKTYDKTYDNIEDKILQFCKNAKSASEITEFCGYKGVDRFKRNYLKPLLQNGKLQMTIPDKPTSKNQKYKTTL